MSSVGIISCIENNRLAGEALLLFASIRRFGGAFSRCSIYGYNPRGLGCLEPGHYAELQTLQVQYIEKVVNNLFPEYPQANKIYAAAHAEKYAKEEILVFLDTDSIVINEPNEFAISENMLGAITPVWLNGIGASSPNDLAQILWAEIFRLCRITSAPPYFRARLSNTPVQFYCNSGLIIVRKSAGIFSRWRDCFEILSSSQLIRELLEAGNIQGAVRPYFFLEQAALAAALIPISRKLKILDRRYNCPLHQQLCLQRLYPSERFDLDTVIHFHYNRALHQVDFLEGDDPLFNRESLQYRWLAERVPLPPVEPMLNNLRFIDTFNSDMNIWRSSLARFRK